MEAEVSLTCEGPHLIHHSPSPPHTQQPHTQQPVEGTMKKRVSSGDTESLRCRFYEQQYPETDEVVVVNVTDIGEMGAYVTLLEYDNIEGMILLSELSRKRIRSINKLVRINRNEVVMVLRVDKEKGLLFSSLSPQCRQDILIFPRDVLPQKMLRNVKIASIKPKLFIAF